MIISRSAQTSSRHASVPTGSADVNEFHPCILMQRVSIFSRTTVK